MKLLEGKSTLVTGGSRGIGKEIVMEFARQGAKVAFTYRSSVEKAEAVKQEAEALGAECLAIQADAADFEACQDVVKQITAAFGGLEVVVNNAGITQDNLLLRMTPEQFDAVIKTNLHSVFNFTKAAMRPMLKARKGSFINMSSIVGVAGNAGQANYAASKGGIIAFTKSVAKEVASRNIRSNAVAPGFIRTEMTDAIPEAELKGWLENIPLKRAGEGKDVADLCVYLASDMSAYMTGQTLHIDGGMYM